jgi:hypothetical protein
MALTYEPIATTTVGTAVNGITFSSIPSSYTDLVIVINAKLTGTSEDQYIRFNNDTGANYQNLVGRGDPASPPSVAYQTNETYVRVGDAFNSYWGMMKIEINGYSGSGSKRTLIQSAKHSGSNDISRITTSIGNWTNTSAINRIDFSQSAGTAGRYAVGSTITLYGILKA